MNVTVFIIAVTAVTSFVAFSNAHLLDGLLFYPYRMWRNNEWHRLVSCGFVHADMGHLLFNMFALFSFGAYIEESFENVFAVKGRVLYVAMYFLALATADLWNLFKQKNNFNYRSLGASGGVSAVVFAFILLNPFGKLNMFFIPVGIPAFLFGPLYLLYCVYAAKRGGDNVGHLAHFTGSVFGFFFPVIFEPRLLIRFFQMLTGAA